MDDSYIVVPPQKEKKFTVGVSDNDVCQSNGIEPIDKDEHII